MTLVNGVPVYLMLTLAFTAAAGLAMLRRDGPSVLAMAVAALGAGHLAGVPQLILAWGLIVTGVAMAAAVIAVVLHALAGARSTFALGLAGTLAACTALILSDAHPSWAMIDHPPRVGVAISREVNMLVAASGSRAPAVPRAVLQSMLARVHAG